VPRNPSALLAVPSKASGAVPNTLVPLVVDMVLAALEMGGVGSWTVAGCFPSDVDAMAGGVRTVATPENFLVSSCLGVSDVCGSVDVVVSGETLAVVRSRIRWLVSRSCDTSAVSSSSSAGKLTGRLLS